MNASSSGNWLFLNASASILTILPDHVMVSIESFEKAYDIIDAPLPLIFTSVNVGILLNAYVPTVFNDEGNVTLVNLVPSNEPYDIVSTEFGNVIDVKPVFANV